MDCLELLNKLKYMGNINTINVIESVDGVINNLRAFPSNKYCIPEAEALFKKLAIDNGAEAKVVNVHIEDGYYKRGNYMVSLVHSVI